MVNVSYADRDTKTALASAPGAERRNGSTTVKSLSIMFVIETRSNP